MYDTLVRLYARKHDKAQIWKATQPPKNWITEAQYYEIIGEEAP